MQGKHLLAIAKLAGISQSALAAALGLHRSATYRWAAGVRAIPQEYVPRVVQIVGEALQKAIEEFANSARSPDHHKEWLDTPRGLDVVTLMLLFLDEYVHGDYHKKALQQFFLRAIETLNALGAMPPREARQPANAARLVDVGTSLARHGQMMLELGPLYDFVEHMMQRKEARDAAADGHRDASKQPPRSDGEDAAALAESRS